MPRIIGRAGKGPVMRPVRKAAGGPKVRSARCGAASNGLSEAKPILPSAQLALRELERAAGLGLAVFLALDHARVAGEKAVVLEDGTQVRLVIRQRLGDAVPYGSGLTGEPPSRHGPTHVDFPA